MFLTSTESKAMNGSSPDTERQNLLERLLDAVKQCQVRFGGKTELATDTDSRVTCLLAQLEAIFQHGIKKPKGTARALRHVGQAAGLVKQVVEPVFWNFILEHLGKMEEERFLSLHNITTDAGRGRAWLRSTLNELTLEKAIHGILGDQTLLGFHYEQYAFLRDEERASMLPMMAAGLSSILFALVIDKEELNTVKQVPNTVQSSKEVFATILSSFPSSVKAKEESTPAPVYSESVTDTDSTFGKKKKRLKRKKLAAIASIEEGEGSIEDIDENNYSHKEFAFSKGFPLNDATTISHTSPLKAKGHSRSSSYPGKIATGGPPNSAGTSLPKMQLSEGFVTGKIELSRQISLSETSLAKDNIEGVNWSEENTRTDFKVGQTTFYTGQAVNIIEEYKEEEYKEYSSETSNFTFDLTHGITSSTFNENFNETPTSNILDNTSSQSTEILSKSQIEPSEILNDTALESISSKDRTILGIPSSFKSFNQGSSHSHDAAGADDTGSSSTGVSAEELEEAEVGQWTSPEAEPYMVIGSGESLTPVQINGSRCNGAESPGVRPGEPGDREDRNISRDNISISSNSWIDEEECLEQQGDDSLSKARLESLTAATDAAVAALELCAHAQSKDASSITRTLGDGSANTYGEPVNRKDSMSTSELKQALVSMMLRKDEIEEQNRTIRQLLEEKRREIEGLRAETDEIREEAMTRSELETATISALTRENEVLKHQLKKYVSAVQMLRSDMKEKQFTDAAASLGIRQDEVLPRVPERTVFEERESEEANEYEQKLIQVAEMHGELMEFNERLQRQINYWQVQTRRLREELINLRGPLPEDCRTADDAAHFGHYDPSVESINTRPLISVWIPSVFMRGKGSSGVHLYQVYIRITDEEWNIYRRYSQFHDLHKKLYKKYTVVGSFKFPPKKTIGNKGTKFVEERRKSLQEYLRRVVNLITTTEAQFSSQTSKAALLRIVPFFGDPYPPNKGKIPRDCKQAGSGTRGSDPYAGL